ncbi:MAG: 3-dehydroquinate synthase [Acidobacteria bacterium]|jgi:3-dehydroquinate synthase|nr:3-dehydroquinate synthase [Acidobacteriota bacterium]
MGNISVKLNGSSHRYEIKIGHDLLNNCSRWANKCLLPETKKIALVSNAKVFGLYGEVVKKSFENAGFEVFVWKMGDGEKYKNLRSLEKALKFFSQNKLKRTDAVAALGGGVVGDLAGFAAAIYLRGVPFLQIPTTLLAMIDSSVGGKTAVNTEFGKNLIGAFYQPNGVLIDIETLKTLPRRELVAGFCEAVKQGAIANQKLFDQTAEFLRNYSPANFKNYFSDKKFLVELENLLAAQVRFKAEIVMQDERESVARIDAKSRKILNFGHTLAHALEKITDYKYFKHGEAVGCGILFAAELSKKLNILDKKELKLLNDVLRRVGKLPDTSNIKIEKVFEAFAFDKKAIGESLQFILLEKIGKPVIRQTRDIPESAIEKSLETVLHK